MAKDAGHRDVVDRLMVDGAFYDEVLDVAEEGKVLEEESGILGRSVTYLLEVSVADREFSSVRVGAVRCCGDRIGPFHKLQGVFESHTAEYVLSATRGPRFRDQGAAPETGFVGAEIIEDFVNDLDGYVNHVSATSLAGHKEV